MLAMDSRTSGATKADELQNNAPVQLFAISEIRLVVLCVITLGFYSLYWGYKNWQGLGRLDGTIKHPFWRSLFFIFYCYSFFKRISVIGKKYGYKGYMHSGIFAGIYVLLTIVGNAWGTANLTKPSRAIDFTILALGSLLFVPLLFTQKAINYVNQKQKMKLVTKFTKKELALIVAGIILLIMSLFAVFGIQAPAKTLTSEQQVRANELGRKADSLGSQYKNCSDALDKKQNSVNTDNQKAVDAYNTDYDKCEAIRVEQNKAVDDYSSLTGQ